MFAIPKEVEIVEVGPRDGLQNEKAIISTKDKVKLINYLAEANLRRIEATSFVHPKWIPQLHDAEEVLAQIERPPRVRYSALIPNMRGFQRAEKTRLHEICLFLSACQIHNKKNLNCSPEESLEKYGPIVEKAQKEKIVVRVDISMAFGSPFEGDIDFSFLLFLITELQALQVQEICLCDTIGIANPRQVYFLFQQIQEKNRGLKFAAHFHNTRGLGLANVVAALQAGIMVFDSSIGGLGGCPYAPNATGNIATEDLVFMLSEMGIQTGIDLDILLECSGFIEETLKKPLASNIYKVIQSS